jgi:hypothetical protein
MLPSFFILKAGASILLLLSLLQLVFSNSSLLHDGALKTCLQIVVAMNWHRYPQIASVTDENMVTTCNTGKCPIFSPAKNSSSCR